MALKNCDFGFVHQILTFKRLREDSLGSITEDINTLRAGHLEALVRHGKAFLTQQENLRNVCMRGWLEFYNFLAVSAMRGRRDKRFWNYHRMKTQRDGRQL